MRWLQCTGLLGGRWRCSQTMSSTQASSLLPVVVLAFGHFGTIPAAGIILTVIDEDDPPSWDKNLTGPELERANGRWRKTRDERGAELDWLVLGRSEERSERVVSLDDARARRAAG